jgi:hypothetical protein
VNIVITDVSGATVSAAPSLKDLSGAVVVAPKAPVANDLSGAVVAPKAPVVNDLSGAVVAPKDLSGAVVTPKPPVVKDLSGAAVVAVVSSNGCCTSIEKQAVKEWNSKDLSGAVVAKEVKAKRSSCCCGKKAVDVAVAEVTKDLSGSTVVTDLSGVIASVLLDLSGASVNDVILALPRLLVAAQVAGAADNSALVKMKHSARALLSQSVKSDPAAAAFADTYLHAVCSALLLAAGAAPEKPVAAGAVPEKPLAAVAEVAVIEKKATTGGRSWFVFWSH